ncbi:Predicted Zn-dependent peptidase [Gracilibacillus ureilyticus]|uniref:Predicted Zn-dependent peptidase n=1 Tax=Gracilibacillus ureilyticus TaxID=531814 RepID=A0A1H9L9A2_9BACI|nr:pitrilysin family protein [Gracilibacillus ureilyticus]SER07715.1 Predicted Zn-dependent peptidase [Gracilibacillus ureilyticus]
MIHRKILGNGLKIVLEPITTVRSVAVGIWIKTGSRHENNEENGISHFIEHMLFKGTSNYSPKQIAEAFDSIGGEINAFTSKEYTCLYAKVLDSHIDFALNILTDMLFDSTFLQEELDREKKVIMEEINMTEDTPDDIIHDYLAEVAYTSHPLANPILGSKANIQLLSRDKLMQYYHHHYTAENIVVSVAGNVSAGYLDQLSARFSDVPSGKVQDEIKKPVFHPGNLKKSKDTEQAHLCLGFEGVGITDKNIYSFMLVNNVLGGSMSSRLFQEIREKYGMAYSIYSYHSSFIDTGMLTIYAGTSPNQLDDVQQLINQTLLELKKDGITEKEFQNSKEQLKGLYLLSLESTNSRMSRNARNELLLEKHPTMDDVIDEIDQMKMDQVAQVIDQFAIDKGASTVITSK